MRRVTTIFAVLISLVFGLLVTASPSSASAMTLSKTKQAKIVKGFIYVPVGNPNLIVVRLNGLSRGLGRHTATVNGVKAPRAMAYKKCTYAKAKKYPRRCSATFQFNTAGPGIYNITIKVGPRKIPITVNLKLGLPSNWRDTMLLEVNKVRAAAGVPPVAYCANLEKQAQAHSEDMAKKDYFSHGGLNGSTPQSRGVDAGYGMYVGENIGAGYASVDKAMESWMNNPEHYANLIRADYKHVGFGYAADKKAQYGGTRWTQDFGVQGVC